MRKLRIILVLLILGVSVQAQKEIRSFIFGHSLLDHRPPIHPTPSDETTVPHWMYLLASEAGHQYAATGKYGFLPQHAMLPPFAQWGYDMVPPVWDSDNEAFHEADFNQVILTAANFAQWQPPHFLYPGDTLSPVSATRIIVDWLEVQEDSLAVYIYENWPDMAPYLNSGFPPSADEFDRYHVYTEGTFHDWWIEYHDSIRITHPEVRMIPVGPIIARLLQLPELGNITPLELYEDDAPHGRPNIYFLASVITYMATCQERAPNNLTIPDLIHPDIRAHWSIIVDEIWEEFLSFNLPNGESRVFFKRMTTQIKNESNDLVIYPNPAQRELHIDGAEGKILHLINSAGVVVYRQRVNQEATVTVDHLVKGNYILRVVSPDGEVNEMKLIIQ